MRYHISKSGKVTPCRAKHSCPLGTSVGGAEARQRLLKTVEEKNNQDGKYEYYKETGQSFNLKEASERGKYVDSMVSMMMDSEKTSDKIHYDPEKDDYTDERKILHDELIGNFIEKHKNVPSNRKVIFSAGLPGAGKSTILRSLENEYPELSMKNYATISADDFKEALAERGEIPRVEGLSLMESSTLVHNESAYLAERALERLSTEGKNVIFDFTCRDFGKTARNMSILASYGYEEKDMQFVYVDIPIEVAKKRAIERYASGLNAEVTMNSGYGGRYMPEDAFENSRSNSGLHSSKSSETVIAIYSIFKEKGLPVPIVYDNSGDINKNPNFKPEKIEFENFKTGEKRQTM